MTDREVVLARHPRAVLRKDASRHAGHRWLVLTFPRSGLHVGGGATPEEAWRDAASRTREFVAFEARASGLKGEGGA